jgi:hypothetical protein
MKSKIAVLAVLIFLVGCKTKEIKTINKIQSDSSSHIEIKQNIEINTLQTDSGIVIEEEITNYQIETDSAGIKTSMPIKKIKKKWHKYKSEIKAAAHKEIKVEQMVISKKDIKTQSVEKAYSNTKWYLLLIAIFLVLLLLLFFYFK